MPRGLSAGMVTAIQSNQLYLCFLAKLTFRSETVYVWTGAGNITFGGQTYIGIGDLGKIGKLAEGTATRSDGTSVSLSGINPAILSECLTDIQLGAAASLYLGFINPETGTFVDTPYQIFSGLVDKPTISPGVDTIAIALALETKMTNHARPNARRYTNADQQIDYPGDTAFIGVEALNDQALRWALGNA